MFVNVRRSLAAVVADDLIDLEDDFFGNLGLYGIAIDHLTQMKSPGMYFSHVAYFFKAMMSAGMMIGASDLSVLMHMKSKSPAIGKDIVISLPVDIGCPSLSMHDSKSVL